MDCLLVEHEGDICVEKSMIKIGFLYLYEAKRKFLVPLRNNKIFIIWTLE